MSFYAFLLLRQLDIMSMDAQQRFHPSGQQGASFGAVSAPHQRPLKPAGSIDRKSPSKPLVGQPLLKPAMLEAKSALESAHTHQICKAQATRLASEPSASVAAGTSRKRGICRLPLAAGGEKQGAMGQRAINACYIRLRTHTQRMSKHCRSNDKDSGENGHKLQVAQD